MTQQAVLLAAVEHIESPVLEVADARRKAESEKMAESEDVIHGTGGIGVMLSSRTGGTVRHIGGRKQQRTGIGCSGLLCLDESVDVDLMGYFPLDVWTCRISGLSLEKESAYYGSERAAVKVAYWKRIAIMLFLLPVAVPDCIKILD